MPTQTWVLIAIALQSVPGASLAITNVPGYESQEACWRAGEQLFKAMNAFGIVIRWECINGPLK